MFPTPVPTPMPMLLGLLALSMGAKHKIFCVLFVNEYIDIIIIIKTTI